MVDEEPWFAATPASVGTLRAALTDRRTWVVTTALAGVAVLMVALLDASPSPSSLICFTAIPLFALAVTSVWLVRRGAWLGLGALVLGVSPAVLVGMSVGDRWGGLGALIAAAAAIQGAVGVTPSRAGRVAIGGAAALLVVAWIWRSPSTSPKPSTSTVVANAGRLTWDAFGSLGGLALVPTSAWLCWWIAIGIVVGAGVVVGDLWAATIVGGSVTLLLAIGLVTLRWKGAVDMSGGTWIVAGAVAFVGSSLDIARARQRRQGAAVLTLTALVWVIAVADLARQ